QPCIGHWSLVIWSFSYSVSRQGRTRTHIRRLIQNRQLDQSPLRFLTLGSLEFVAKDRPLALDLLLEVDDRLDQLFGPRRTAGNVHVDGDEAIYTLNDGVGVEHTAGRSTRSHRDAPLGLVHLQPDAL